MNFTYTCRHLGSIKLDLIVTSQQQPAISGKINKNTKMIHLITKSHLKYGTSLKLEREIGAPVVLPLNRVTNKIMH